MVDIFAFKKANVVSSANPTVVFKSAVGDLKAGANWNTPFSTEYHGIGKNVTMLDVNINKKSVDM